MDERNQRMIGWNNKYSFPLISNFEFESKYRINDLGRATPPLYIGF